MDTEETAPTFTSEHITPSPGASKLHSQSVLVSALFLAVVAFGVLGIYYWQQQKIASLNASISNSRTAIVNLSQQLTAANDQNNGIVAATAKPSNSVSLVNGQVTFTMPSGWITATASRFYQQCNNGSYDSKAVCLDSTTIVPSALNTSSSSSTYGGITVSVYKNTGTASAQDLFASEGGMGAYDSHVQIQFLTINGYSAWYGNNSKVPLEYGDQFNNEGYTLINKSYVVTLSSNVNNNAGPNGTMKFNDNSQYSPTVKSFVNSIKMQGN